MQRYTIFCIFGRSTEIASMRAKVEAQENYGWEPWKSGIPKKHSIREENADCEKVNPLRGSRKTALVPQTEDAENPLKSRRNFFNKKKNDKK